MKILVVYYSRTGHTKKIGDMIADTLKCDHEEIVELKNRSGILGWLLAGRDATLKDVTKIAPAKYDASVYELIIIGTPVHSFGLSAPARTYLRENKNKFNKVAFYCTCGSMGMDRAFRDMEAEIGKKPEGKLWVTEKELKKGNYTEKIGQFIKSING